MNLKDFAVSYKSKKELYDLSSIPIDIEIKPATFKGEDNKEIPYNYIEIDGYKYTIKANLIKQLSDCIKQNAEMKSFKVVRTSKGELIVVPLA